MQKEKIIVVLGPTSSGKTALSIELAKACDGEIISADSRQVYRGLNLGTGKVTRKEMAGVPHHLLDVADPKKQFSVSEYVALAEHAIRDIISRGKVPIICGGTGLYIDTLVNGIVLPQVPPDPKLRKVLEQKSASVLYAMLIKLDPARAKTIDKDNPVRLVRAIEIAKALGTVPKIKTKTPYQSLKIGLDMPDATLKERIEVRLKERIKKGMIREAASLHRKGLSWRRMNDLGLEYRAMAEFLTKKTDKKTFEETLLAAIWQYARRQRTWFKRDETITWYNPTQKSTLKKVLTQTKTFLKNA